MAKAMKSNYGLALKAAMICKVIVAVVFFAVLINIVNLSAFHRGTIADINTLPLQQQSSDVYKILNTLNIPMKIVGNFFNFNNKASENEKQSKEQKADDNKYAVISEPIKIVNAQFLKRNFSMQANDSGFFQSIPFGEEQGIFRLKSFYFDNFIRILMLLLILASILPRGISINKIKKYIYLRIPSLSK